jgi:type II secretory pathway pseudopilin PulG
MPTRFRTGFTLAEILGVFVLILVIAAILFPVYQQQVNRHRSRRRSSCASDLKQLGIALNQYQQDNDEICPSGINTAGNGWAGEIYPFIKTVYVYQCPDDPLTIPFVSYTENQNIVKQKLINFTNPAVTVALYETSTLNCDPSQPETVSATGRGAPQNSTRHGADFGLNFLVLDSHVRYLTPTKVAGGPAAVSAKSIPQGTYVETFAIK